MSDNKTVQSLRNRVEELEKEQKRLIDAIVRQEEYIEQVLGQALGYPWYKDDQKNFPGAEAADGVCVGNHVAETIAMEMADKYTKALARIKELEGAGDALCFFANGKNGRDAINRWKKAKEEKP